MTYPRNFRIPLAPLGTPHLPRPRSILAEEISSILDQRATSAEKGVGEGPSRKPTIPVQLRTYSPATLSPSSPSLPASSSSVFIRLSPNPPQASASEDAQKARMRKVKIFSGSSHPELAGLILERLGLPPATATLKRFSNAETAVEIGVSVRNEDVYIIQSGSSQVNDDLMELLIFINACKIASARRITAVLPYFPYNKQSKKKKIARGAITAKLVANMLSVAGVDHVITMDLHSSQVQGFFSRPVDNLLAEPTVAKYIRDKYSDWQNGVIVSKNAGGAKRATSLADRLKIDFALIHREKNHIREPTETPTTNGNGNETDESTTETEEDIHHYQQEDGLGELISTRLTLVGDVRGKPAFIVDDAIDSTHSFLDAAVHLKLSEASKVYIVATHGILAGNACREIEECVAIDEVIVTNSYPISDAKKAMTKKLRIMDISGVLAEAIRRTHNVSSASVPGATVEYHHDMTSRCDLDTTMETLQEFVCDRIRLIQAEQDAEVEQITELQQKISQTRLFKLGILLSGLRITGSRTGICGQILVDFESGVGGQDALPPHTFRMGDIVCVEEHVSARSSKKIPIVSPHKTSGVLCRVNDKMMTVSFKQDEEPDDDWQFCRISKLANYVTYERMKTALKSLGAINPDSSSLVSVLFGLKTPTFSTIPELTYFDPTLNESQREAVSFTCSADHVALIHGPPGTGKTQTCVEAIRQLVARGERVLACGSSNISVDNLAERLSKSRIEMVRVGHPARVLGSVLDHSLEVRIKTSDEGQIVNDVRKDIDGQLAAASKCKSRVERRQIYNDVKQLRQELKQREIKVMDTIVTKGQVVLSTLSGAASRVLQKEKFDTVVIDEASQALEPESWIAILKAKRVILAGDHEQLPPTIKSTPSNPSKPSPLSKTLFDRMLEKYGDSVKRMLTIQYRMNQTIMKFSSSEFYENKLIAHKGVKDGLLCDLDGVESTDDTTVPLVFIDTSTSDLRESTDSDSLVLSESKTNEGEATLVLQHIQSLTKSGVKDSHIVILSPYAGQVSLLRNKLRETHPNLEIGTIDGMQGREKEAVVLSLVRSNENGEVGFLSDRRRLNVGLTRAKKHLCVVGDAECISRKNKFLKRMCAYMEENAEVRYPDM
ncbi:ribose-phosphate diphosphokinase [Synchytrium endobioticum]|uniref:Ribose-phosphate pyrophosphokinase 1 n=1 Tax=Synchytrium endobioticum TaxID=286115 RepID=A0A507D1Q7_9FUNG|nr:ribose-phosphate diphosphokinase [Synchytrium endobioticum]